MAAGAPLPPTGKPLGKLNTDDLTAVVERGLKLYSRLNLNKVQFSEKPRIKSSYMLEFLHELFSLKFFEMNDLT